MLGKISGAWNELSSSEKLEVVFFLFILSFATIAILLAMAWSRGREVDMLKDRVSIMEDRWLSMAIQKLETPHMESFRLTC